LMWENDCGAIPVVDDGDHLVGMLTDRDICMSAYTQGSPLHAIPVHNAMAREVFACGPNDTLEQAEQLMAEKRIRRIPIVDDDNQPLGVLSINDIARHAAAARKKNGLEHEVTQTLAAIGKPWETRKPSKTRRPGERASSSASARLGEEAT